MNPSTALARVLVDELVRCGVRDAVLCPGSRSAPLAYALQDADRAGLLRLHVRVDERSAGFLALGLAAGSGRVVPVVTTSGTAVANLHPAVLEAHHSGVPVLVLSADRPHELRGTGANQTTVQPGLFGSSVRYAADLPAPETATPGVAAAWRTTLDRACAAVGGAAPGPGHVNLAFRDPLAPDPDAPSGLPAELVGRPGGAPWTERGVGILPVHPDPAVARPGRLPDVERTVVVVGGGIGSIAAREAVEWARLRGYPVIAEPFGAFVRGAVSPHGPLLLTCTDWLDAHAPERVVVVGRPTLARPVASLLRRPGLVVEAVVADDTRDSGLWPDPGHVLSRVHPWSVIDGDLHHLRRAQAEPHVTAYGTAWREAGERVAAAVAADPPVWGTGLAVARVIGEALPSLAELFVGASNPVRDLDLGLVRSAQERHVGLVVRGNRGLAGIDGTVSTAVGLALALGHARPTYAWLGDLTFLHDTNGLLIGPDEPRPDLTILVTNDDGGGIFTTLEYGADERAADFERVFGTPTRTDLAALCRAHGIPHRRVVDPDELRAAVAETPSGVRVVEVPLDRSLHRAAHARLRESARNALRAATP